MVRSNPCPVTVRERPSRGDQAVDFLLCMRLSVSELAEQDIVLDGYARVVAGLIEELDAEILALRDFPDFSARLQNTLLDGVSHESETMARNNQLER